MKRIFLNIAIVSLLLPVSGQVMAADNSFLSSTLRSLKSVLAIGVASFVGIAAYNLWNKFRTQRVIKQAEKVVQADNKPVENRFKGEIASQEAQLLMQKSCVFTRWSAYTPRTLDDARQKIMAEIRELLENDHVPLCDVNGNPIQGKTNRDIAVTLKADEKKIRFKIGELGMGSVIDHAFGSASTQAFGINKQLREKPWTRSNVQQIQFEQEMQKAIVGHLENENALVKAGKKILFGDTEFNKAAAILDLCKELERNQTLQHMVNQEIDREEQAKKVAQARVAQVDSDAKYAAELAAGKQPVSQVKATKPAANKTAQQQPRIQQPTAPAQDLPPSYTQAIADTSNDAAVAKALSELN